MDIKEMREQILASFENLDTSDLKKIIELLFSELERFDNENKELSTKEVNLSSQNEELTATNEELTILNEKLKGKIEFLETKIGDVDEVLKSYSNKAKEIIDEAEQKRNEILKEAANSINKTVKELIDIEVEQKRVRANILKLFKDTLITLGEGKTFFKVDTDSPIMLLVNEIRKSDHNSSSDTTLTKLEAINEKYKPIKEEDEPISENIETEEVEEYTPFAGILKASKKKLSSFENGAVEDINEETEVDEIINENEVVLEEALDRKEEIVEEKVEHDSVKQLEKYLSDKYHK